MRISPPISGAFGVAAALAVGLGVAVAPSASAVVVAVDRPVINTATMDFANTWAAGTPLTGGFVRWDQNAAGVAPWVDGRLYLSAGTCGRVQVQYFDSAHVQLGTANGANRCAPAAGGASYPVSLRGFRDPAVDHVHINLVRNVGGAPVIVGIALEDL